MLHEKSVEYTMKSFMGNDGFTLVGFVELSDTGKVKNIDKKIVANKRFEEIVRETVLENKYQIFNLEGLKTNNPTINLLEVV